MVCLGVEPGVAGCKAQTNPLSYCSTPFYIFLIHTLVTVVMGDYQYSWIINPGSSMLQVSIIKSFDRT